MPGYVAQPPTCSNVSLPAEQDTADRGEPGQRGGDVGVEGAAEAELQGDRLALLELRIQPHDVEQVGRARGPHFFAS